MLDEVKKSIRSQLRHLPDEGRMVLDAYRQLLLLRRKARAKLRAGRGEELPDPETIYWIDPGRIVKHTNFVRPGQAAPLEDRVFDPEADRGAVYGGEWDIAQLQFDDLDIVRAIRERVRSGVDWHATEFHRNMMARIGRGGRAPWSSSSPAALEERYRYLDELIESIRQNGFRLCHEISLPGEDKGLDGHAHYGAEVSVNIDRDGHYVFQDGRHRLAIAKALGLPRVPVKVLVRHRKWVEFRELIRSLAEGGGGSSRSHELYQNPLHPDLQDIPAAHACEDRFMAIQGTLLPGAGKVLDIGANLGYFCHRFESLGYECHAVELLPQIALAAEKIRIAEGRRFKVICDDLFAASLSPPLRGQHYRVVLGLSIFHHFLKRKETYEKFRSWLSSLNADSMYFEPHCPDEPQMAGAHVNPEPREFVDFILRHSSLRQAELIERCPDGRPIFRLWR